MENLILALHVAVCVILIILVLLQSGKEGMGVIFGGGSQSLFGSTGAGGILVKLTTFIALIFVATSLGYNIATTEKTVKESVVIDLKEDDPFEPTVVVPQDTPSENGDSTPADSSATPVEGGAPVDGTPSSESPAADTGQPEGGASQ